MKNTWGQSLTLTLFGESHGPKVGAVVDGLCPGLPVSMEEVERQLSRRRPSGVLDTPRVEQDRVEILSGVFQGHTTGTPLCLTVDNTNTKSDDYVYGSARPSHGDYAGHCKYRGYEDYRGGGHFSGRITAALVAVGGILLPSLERKGITVGTHILRCGKAEERSFGEIREDVAALKIRPFPTLTKEGETAVSREILQAKEEGDSVGGVLQTAVCGLPAGVGEPWFDSVEGLLAHALYSIGGVKGVEFGLGFAFGESRGSVANDPFCIKDGMIITKTNHSGGINGGITNGMPVVFQTAVRPTPTLYKEQDTVNFITMEETKQKGKGRHDPAIIRRICPVVDSVTALVVADLLSVKYGTDFWGTDP